MLGSTFLMQQHTGNIPAIPRLELASIRIAWAVSQEV